MDEQIANLCSGDSTKIALAIPSVPQILASHSQELYKALNTISAQFKKLLLQHLRPHDNIVDNPNTPRTNLVLYLLTNSNVSRFPSLNSFLTELAFTGAVTTDRLRVFKEAYAASVLYTHVTARLFAEKTLADAFLHVRELAGDFASISFAMVRDKTTTLSPEDAQTQAEAMKTFTAKQAAKVLAQEKLKTFNTNLDELCRLLQTSRDKLQQRISDHISEAKGKLDAGDTTWFDADPPGEARKALGLIQLLREDHPPKLTAASVIDWDENGIANRLINNRFPKIINEWTKAASVSLERPRNNARVVTIADVAADVRGNKRKTPEELSAATKVTRTDDLGTDAWREEEGDEPMRVEEEGDAGEESSPPNAAAAASSDAPPGSSNEVVAAKSAGVPSKGMRPTSVSSNPPRGLPKGKPNHNITRSDY